MKTATAITVVMLIAVAATAAQARLKLGAVDVAGAKRYTSPDVAKVAGLKPGQAITVEELTQAADRLGQSGLFKSLSFRYVTKGDAMSVTFEFEEADWTVPVTFDNFVWFTDEEVRAAVRDGLPTFDGKAPSNEGIPNLISTALQSLLQRRGVTGRIHFSPQADLKGNLLGLLFSVRDPAPKVCAVRFDGASAIPPDDLAKAMPIIGSDYSRTYTDNSAKGTLRDRYRRQGYWAAAFAPATAAIDAGCDGVTVTLNVSEGPQYAWDRAGWTGSTALTPDELSALLPLKSGEPAALLKIEDGLRAVTRAYGKRGYITANATYSPRLDAASRKAVFEFRVSEGPQFRFGNVQFSGFSEADAASLMKKWQLAAGDVFDDTYPTTFFAQVLRPALQRAAGRQVDTELRVNESTRTVDVRYVLK